jgi:hypothetical protein
MRRKRELKANLWSFLIVGINILMFSSATIYAVYRKKYLAGFGALVFSIWFIYGFIKIYRIHTSRKQSSCSK